MTKKFQYFILEKEQDLQSAGLYDENLTYEQALSILDSIPNKKTLGNGFFSRVLTGSEGDLVVKISMGSKDNTNQYAYDPWFTEWAPFCLENNFSNSHLPVIKHLKIFDEDHGHGLAILEKLYDFGNYNRIWEALQVDEWTTHSSEHSPRNGVKLMNSMRYLVEGRYLYLNDYTEYNSIPSFELFKENGPEGILDLKYLSYRLFQDTFSSNKKELKDYISILDQLGHLYYSKGAVIDLHGNNFGFTSRGEIVFLDPVS